MFDVKKFFVRQAAVASSINVQTSDLGALRGTSEDSISTPPLLATFSPDDCFSDSHPRSATDSAYGVDNFVRIDFLSELPYEIAVHILSFVPELADLVQVSLVSKRWYRLSADNEVWKSLFIKQWGATLDRKVLALIREGKYLQSPQIPTDEHTCAAECTDNFQRQCCINQNSPDQVSKLVRPRFSPIGRSSASPEPHLSIDWKYMYAQRVKLHFNWHKSIGDIPKSVLEGHTDSVYCIQFDGSRIVSGSRDRSVKFWDVNTGKIIRELHGHQGSVLCLQYDDDYLVTGSSDSTIRIWCMKTGRCKRVLYGHSQPVLDVRFNQDKIVSCSKDFSIKVWDFATGNLIRSMDGHRAAVNAIHLHGNVVASASGDTEVRLWNINSGQCIQTFVGHERGLACVQYDGTYVVSGSNDRKIRVWDAKTGQCIHTLQGHTDLVRTLCFNKNYIVSGSYDQTIRIWDFKTGQCIQKFDNAHESWVFHVQIEASRMISASQDKKIIVWDYSEGVPEALAFR